MTARRASLALLAVLWAAAASAQAPLRLGPEANPPDTPADAPPAPAVPVSPSATTPLAGFWAGTPRGTINGLIAALPARIASPAARGLLRAAMTEGDPPPGDTAGWRAARAAALLAAGDTAAAAGLIAGDESGPGLAVQRDLLLLNQDDAAACALAETQAERTPDRDWIQALVFCDLRERRRDRAEATMNLLRDAPEEDVSFTRLAFAAMGIRAEPVTQVATPLHLALLRLGRPNPPLGFIDQANPALLASVAETAAVPAAIRLAVADRAALFGGLSDASLRARYDAVQFTVPERQALANVSDNDRGPRGRAALARALHEASASDRPEILLRLWRLGRDRGFYPLAVRIGAASLGTIAPSQAVAGFAPQAMRAYLSLGERGRAIAWHDMIADDQVLSWPLLRILGLTGPDRFGAFARELEARDGTAARVRIDAARVLLAAIRAGEGGARPIEATSDETVLDPGRGMEVAAASGRRGETALQAVRLLAQREVPSIASAAAVARALGMVGLNEHARAVALEAALAHGL